MRIRVLGSAAGGGFPQWNCGCANCRDVRSGARGLVARAEECVAVSADDEHWFLLNCPPEIRRHIEAWQFLWPRSPRHTPIAGLLLTNGDLDHCLGLLCLRESQPLSLLATEAVRRGFTENNVLYRTLERFPGQASWTRLALDEEVSLRLPDGGNSGLAVTAVGVPGKRALHLEIAGGTPPSPEDNVALRIRETRADGKTLCYASAVGSPSPSLDRALAGAACVFLDGTFWSSDELIAAGLGTRRAEEMAHWPVGGPSGSARFLQRTPAARKVLIHINNTNPILREGSPERRELAEAGVEVAHDGMEIVL